MLLGEQLLYMTGLGVGGNSPGQSAGPRLQVCTPF